MYSTVYLHLEAGTDITLGTASPRQIGISFDGNGPCIIGLSPSALDRLGALCIAGATALREARQDEWAAAAVADLGFGGAS